MIVSNYNGKLFSNSKISKGSTFGFTMDLKYIDVKSLRSKNQIENETRSFNNQTL